MNSPRTDLGFTEFFKQIQQTMRDVYEANKYTRAETYYCFVLDGVESGDAVGSDLLCEAFDKGADITFLAFLKNAKQTAINLFIELRGPVLYRNVMIFYMVLEHGNVSYDLLRDIQRRLDDLAYTGTDYDARVDIAVALVTRTLNTHPAAPQLTQPSSESD